MYARRVAADVARGTNGGASSFAGGAGGIAGSIAREVVHIDARRDADAAYAPLTEGALRRLMFEKAGVVRDRAGLAGALAILDGAAIESGPLRNMITVARLIVGAALRARREPRQPLPQRCPARRRALRAAPRDLALTAAPSLVEPARILVEPLVRAALQEDLGGAGDLTTDAIAGKATMRVAIVARKPGRLAALGAALLAFELLDPALRIERRAADGSRVEPGTVVARISGSARAILSAERTALNLLARTSGVATATAALTELIAGTHAHVVCTRKTTPGLRLLEKYAVRCGGGANHRFGLDDAVLIKDNHIALAGGVAAAVTSVRAHVGHLVKVEIEADTLAQVREALALPIDAILFDNMSPGNYAKRSRLRPAG